MTSPAFRVKYLLLDDVSLQAIVLDAVPGDPSHPRRSPVRLNRSEGLLFGIETALLHGAGTDLDVSSATRRRARRRKMSRLEEPPYDGKVALGAWMYSSRFPTIDGSDQGRNWGTYALAEWNLVADSNDASQGLAGFVRIGGASRRVNRFGAYVGAGLVYTGPFPGRDPDQAGFAGAAAINGDPFMEQVARLGRPAERAEASLEWTYQAFFVGFVAVQADLQYVINPGTNPAYENALVATLRLQVTL